MKVAITAIVLVFLVFVSVQAYSFSRRRAELEEQYRAVTMREEEVERDYRALQAELDYFLRPENLEKELRARFNYRSPDEKLIIIVPATSSAARPRTP